jgi:hypothetical protein
MHQAAGQSSSDRRVNSDAVAHRLNLDGPVALSSHAPRTCQEPFPSLFKRCVTLVAMALLSISRKRELEILCPKHHTQLLSGFRLVVLGKRALGGLNSATQSAELVATEKGKPLARGGRKTTGLPESAGSPK